MSSAWAPSSKVLTGQPPHAGSDGLFDRILEGRIEPVRSVAPWVSRPLAAVCAKALMANPEQRYQSAGELADEVKRWLAGEPVLAWPEPWTVKARRWVGRHRVLAASTMVGLLVTLVLLGAGGFWWRQNREQERLAEIVRRQRAAQRAEAGLALAEQMRKRMRWKESEQLLNAAQEAGREAEDEGLSETVRQAQADLALARELDRVHEQGHALVDGRWNPMHVKDRYPVVFADHGLDVLAGPVEPLARRISESSLRAEILAALDDWTVNEPEKTRALRLLELASRVDSTNPWRKRLLAPGGLSDRARLLALLRQSKGEALGPATAILLSAVLGATTPEGIDLVVRARRRNPDDFRLNFDLGGRLLVPKEFYVEERDRARQEEAIGYYRAAVAVKPGSPIAHVALGNALLARGDVEGAIDCHREAIRLDPKDARAHNDLGLALRAQGDEEEALTNLREAVRLDPKDARTHTNLANALLIDWGDVSGALLHLRVAVRLDPKLGQAHCALGQTLMARGNFAEALTFCRQAIDLLPADHPLSSAALDQLRSCKRLLRLERKLDAIGAGQPPPRDGEELVTLADIAQRRGKQLYRLAVRLYKEGFAAEPALAYRHRYNAVCAAVLAAAGRGKDASGLDESERALLRYTALGWLQEYLAEGAGKLAGPSRESKRVRKIFKHWQADADLATVRDADLLRRLSESEQAAWRNLWARVESLLASPMGRRDQ
jgi:tetratricopeptide (TPR) repeat protein